MRFSFLYLSLFLVSNVHPLFLWDSFPFIASPIASQPSIYMFQGNHLDVCPIKTLLKVVERAVSCETVQVSFPHKCSQFNCCSSLNVEVAVTFLASFYYLHDSVVFPETLLSSVGSYLKYSEGVFAPRDPQSTNQSTFSHRTSHSQLSSIFEWSRRLPISNLVLVSDFGWHICGSLFILKQGPPPSSVLGSITSTITS